MFKRYGNKKQVFLGGSCGVTTWRNDLAIPQFKEAGIRFFNPQKGEGEWKPEDAVTEAAALKESAVVLIVIDNSTRGTRSLLEIVEIVMRGQRVIVYIENIPDGAVIQGQTVTGRELQDLNDTRDWVRKFLDRHPNATHASSIDGAVLLAKRLLA